MSTLPIILDSEPCSCTTCQSMCERPCWPIPSEVIDLIDAGKGKRLMLDWWVGGFTGQYHNTFIVCPANPEYEGLEAGDLDALSSGCTFQSNGLCDLHSRGLKPCEGRAIHHASRQSNLHENVARHWDTDEGRNVVATWCAHVGINNPYDE